MGVRARQRGVFDVRSWRWAGRLSGRACAVTSGKRRYRIASGVSGGLY